MWSFQHFFFKTLSVAHFIPLKSVTLYCTEMQISVQHGIKPLHGCQSKQLLEQLQMFLNVWCSFVGEKLSDCAVTLLWYYMQMLYRLKVQTSFFCDPGNADGTDWMINAYKRELKIMQILNTKDESELCSSISLTEKHLSNRSLRGEPKKDKLIHCNKSRGIHVWFQCVEFVWKCTML